MDGGKAMVRSAWGRVGGIETGLRFASLVVLFSTHAAGSDESAFHLGLSAIRAHWPSKENVRGNAFFLGAETSRIQVSGEVGFLGERVHLSNTETSDDPTYLHYRDNLVAIVMRVKYGRRIGFGFWPYAGIGAGPGILEEGSKEGRLFLAPILEVGINNNFFRFLHIGVNYRFERFEIHRFSLETGLRIPLTPSPGPRSGTPVP